MGSRASEQNRRTTEPGFVTTQPAEYLNSLARQAQGAAAAARFESYDPFTGRTVGAGPALQDGHVFCFARELAPSMRLR